LILSPFKAKTPQPLVIPRECGALCWSHQGDSNRRPVEAFFLVSRIDKRTNLGKELRPFLERLDIPTLNTEIAQRISYSEAFLTGKTIDQYAPKTQAAETFQQLKREILSWQTKRLEKLEAGLNQ
jgi:cellulose biosynthesis protein BcsQ